MNKDNQTPVPGQEPENEIRQQDVSDVTEEKAAETEKAEMPEDNTPKAEAHGKKKHRGVSRKFRYGTLSTVLTLVVVAAVVLVNVVASLLNDRFPLNLDLTSDKLFTLSEESRQVAQSIDTDIDVVVFAGEENFSDATTDSTAGSIMRQFYELMKQYETQSGGHVKTTYLDVVANPTLASQYSEYEVQSGDILFIGNGKHKKANINDLASYNTSSYYSTTISGSQVEKIVASNLVNISSEYTPVVALLTGHDEASYSLQGIQSVLSANNYEVREIDITGSEELGDDINTLVIAAPSKDYTDDEIKKIREWMNNGGNLGRNLAVFVNYQADCPNLYEYLNVDFGIEVTNNIIIETDVNRQYAYNQYYLYGDIADTDYTGNSAGDKKALTMVTRQLLTHRESDTSSTLFNTDLITYSDSAQLVTLQEALGMNENSEGEAVVTPFEPEEAPVVGTAMATRWETGEDGESRTSHVLVSGSQDLVNSGLLSSMTTVNNEEFTLDLFGEMTGNQETVNISTQSLDQATLSFSGGQALVIGFGIFTIGLPAVTLIICLVVFLRRRHL